MSGWPESVPDDLRSLHVDDWLNDSERNGNNSDTNRARTRQRIAQHQWCNSNGVSIALFDRWHRFMTDQ